MQIRNVCPDDHLAVDDLIIEAFGQTDEARLTGLLRDSEDLAVELVAEDHGEIVGHIALSRFQCPACWLALAPLSVRARARRKGIGTALVDNALQAARTAGWTTVVVLGDPRYYSRFGFSIEAAAQLTSPYPLKYTGLCALKSQFPLPPLATDTLIYAKAFGALNV